MGRGARARDGSLSILFVCDFFFPSLGGVEMHLWSLAHCLMRRGHKVVVLTHAYGRRKGVRVMANGLKVYYCPLVPFVDRDSFPTFWSMFALFRHVLLRERIDVVHGHQATSTMMHESLLQATTMGYHTVYTDHSLFGFADVASVHLNKMLKFTLSNVDHAICVSHTCRENLVLRAALSPLNVSAIPNAVDAESFPPDPSARPSGRINVVMVTRLVYRKGIDLAVRVVPVMCRRFPQVHFIIAGDGPKMLALEEMREKHQLHDRVELLGGLPHSEVRSVLIRGHIFLNTSLTESFCIAIIEAAACGLFVVSTKVGGVPEVLPPDMRLLAEPRPDALVDALTDAIPLSAKVVPMDFHRRVQAMYSWPDVAERTEAVYRKVVQKPVVSLQERLQRYYGVGPYAGVLCCFVAGLLFLMSRFLEWYEPAETVDVAPDFPRERYLRNANKLSRGERK